MLLDLIGSYSKLSDYSFEKTDDDDFFDKLFRRFSAIMMFIFASLLSIAQLVGNPINCWCHNEYSGKRCAYATTYCYITNFYVPVGNITQMAKRDELQSHKILYYQWVPYIFLVQAFLFYLPCIVWRILNKSSGFELSNYVKELRDDKSGESNSKAVVYVSNHINSCLDFQRKYEHRGRIKPKIEKIFSCRIFNNGSYLTICYMLVKVLYILVAFFQIAVLNYWLRDSYYPVSFDLSLLFGDHNWKWSERFPRMTLCKFQVYILTDQQTHWVQCTLPINIYIEKIYRIVWAWLWILMLVMSFSLISYIVQMWKSSNFLKERVDSIDQQEIESLKRELKPDGILVLRLLKTNTSNYYVTSVLSNLNEIIRKRNS